MSDTEKRINDSLLKVQEMNQDDPDHGEQEICSPESGILQISMLDQKSSRALSPMLQARFEFAGAWINADLDLNWLSLSEISQVYENQEIKELIELRTENWDHVPPATVDPGNCAIFAYNPYEPEEIYLVWNNTEDEPAVWRYLGADYKMFHNLERYLEYLVGDRSIDDTGRSQ